MTNPDPDPLDAPIFSGRHIRALFGLAAMAAAVGLLIYHSIDHDLTKVEAASDAGLGLVGFLLSNQRDTWKDLGGWIVDLVKAIRGGGA